VSKCIYIVSYISKFTYVSAVCKLDSLRNSDNNRGFFLKKVFYFCKEFLNIKRYFRKVDQIRSVAVFGFRKSCGACKPSGITSHDFHNGDHVFLISQTLCIADHFFCGSTDIFRCTPESRCMVCQCQVIVYGFRNAEELLGLSCKDRIIRQFLDSIHGIISADINECINVQLIQDFENLFINCFIFMNLRKFVTAGT